MCIRGRTGRGKEHIATAPELSSTLWAKTACGLTCLPQFPAYWDEVREEDKCLNCRMFHEMRDA